MTSRARTLFLATRPMFFPASAVPVAVGTAWGLREGAGLDLAALALALLGMAGLHAGANVLNDVGDEISGCDRLNEDRIAPFTGGSRTIQDGRLSLRAMALWGLALVAFAAATGLVLAQGHGPVVLWLGLAGGGLAAAYSLPPFRLANRGLGELAVAVGFGLPVAAAAWLQNGAFTAAGMLAAAAIGCWTAAILIVNEIPDRRADAAVGKRTLVVRLGLDGGRRLYLATHAVALAAQAALLLSAGLPAWTLAPPLLLAAAAVAAATRFAGGRAELLTAIRLTLAIHLLGGVWLTLGPLLG